MRIRALAKISAFIVLLATHQASADILVVVNKSNETAALSKLQLIDLYMGRFRTLPNRQPVRLFDHSEDSSLRNQFYRELIDKSVAEVNAFWARLLFTGRAKPPELLSDNDSLFAAIDKDSRAIGYINEQDLQDNMKIVYRLAVN